MVETTESKTTDLPRISVEVTPEVKNFLTKHLRYGEQRLLINIFITTLIEECLKEGNRRPISKYINHALDHHSLLASYKESSQPIATLPSFTREEKEENPWQI